MREDRAAPRTLHARPESTVRLVRSDRGYKQLGQLRPGDTNVATLYTPPTGIVFAVVTGVLICNTGTGSINFSVFHDDNGTTADQTTALYYVQALASAKSVELPANGPAEWGIAKGGALLVQSDTTDDATFTAYGYEIANF